MIQSRIACAFIMALALVAGMVRADVRMFKVSGSEPTQPNPVENPAGSGRWDVVINVGPAAGQTIGYYIEGDEHDSINYISAQTGSSSTGKLQLWIRKCNRPQCDGNGLDRVEAIVKLGSGKLQIFEYHVEGDVYGFSADSIPEVVSDHGDVIGPIVSGSYILGVLLKNGDILAPITALSGNIEYIDVTGNIYSDGNSATTDIYAPNGGIATITVTGNIGTPTSPVSIRARVQPVIDPIFEDIRAANIHADITGTDAVSRLGHLSTVGTPGVFSGSLSVNHIEWTQPSPAPGIFVAGDLDADITLGSSSSPMEIGGSLLAGKKISIAGTMRTYDEPGSNPDRFGQIRIGGSLLGDIEIGTGAHYGLQGFVIINENNSGGFGTVAQTSN